MKKLLVIEDNADVRENLAEILELSGYEVFAAEQGKKGVELAVRENPDLILCDIMMPELDGYGVLKILRANKRTADIPFIFLTAKTEKEDFRKGMGLGADDYITKPFDDSEMLRAIEMRLKKSERMRHRFDSQRSSSLSGMWEPRRISEIIDKLLDKADAKVLRENRHIFERGEPAKYVYYLKTGWLKGYLVNDWGKALVTELYTDGQLIGVEDVLSFDHYQISVKSLKDSELAVISAADLLKTLSEERDFAAFLLQNFSTSIRQMAEQMLGYTYNSVRKRIADALLAVTEGHPEQLNKPAIYLSREDLANMAGTAKETVIRTLSDFKEEGLIDISARKITLVNPEKLRQMPN